jgi:UDP-N-acetylmuramoyl-L-alanyl-D-glutamate--2,6-diaminopimelate ligase
VELQRLLRHLVDSGVTYVALEVSSHALTQHRVDGLDFDTAIFTSFSRDHHDYHGSMESYFRAKASLIERLRPHGTVVVNMDEAAWQRLAGERRRVGYSERITNAEVHAENVRRDATSSSWTLVLGDEKHDVTLPLLGDFNVSNALAAAAGAWTLGIPGSRIASRLATMPQVPGRLEVLRDSPTVLRDYAHTPDALARALDAVRPFTRGKLVVVFGCGGDRDRGKRPEMGGVAASRADVCIVTSDNPRSEDPEAIIDEIVAGIPGQGAERIEDRRAAIARALEIAGPDDVVLLAGKGHETYQIRGSERLPFDERVIVAELSASSSASTGAAVGD